MKIALFSRQVNSTHLDKIINLIDFICKKSTVQIHRNLYDSVKSNINADNKLIIFDNNNIDTNTDLVISLGGDGTLLEAVTIVRDSLIPILGINIGKLGFLSSVTLDDAKNALDLIFKNKYELDKRSLVKLDQPGNLFGEINYGLNEFTVIKRDTSTMITISVYINNLFVNTYWADGLIIATPTGSTGYSLSCGGPIISPETNNLIITPIASHNLTVRPVIIPGNSVIKLKVEEHHQDFLCVFDSRSATLNSPAEMVISKAGFHVNLISLEKKDFYKTIRNKLAWGYDKRN